jgi:hypothetical protein
MVSGAEHFMFITEMLHSVRHDKIFLHLPVTFYALRSTLTL